MATVLEESREFAPRAKTHERCDAALGVTEHVVGAGALHVLGADVDCPLELVRLAEFDDLGAGATICGVTNALDAGERFAVSCQ